MARARRTDRDGKSLVQAHIAKELHKRLKHLAIDRETTVEAILEQAIEAFLEQESADVERDHLIQTAARAALDGLADRRWGIDDFDRNAGIDPSEGIHTDETMAELAAREAGQDWLRLKQRRALDALGYLIATRGLTVGLYKRDGKLDGRYVAGFPGDSNFELYTMTRDELDGIRIDLRRTKARLPELHPSLKETTEIDPADAA
ncbi:UNVERIFIED_ORG: hypothetical protein M2438_002475 [Methylobacterium sp. SuP10 SLI 274]|uniref:ribbon-helix-helix domain-containing protein n=1 Tax=Methylorubrum extorquens TaxID=408 RepID=UPI00209DBA65|nr:ribbon-helix-helix domain-containing protein [Methylorubrum extorquens]MDF9863698.1 hypothetical protein [Methylorubrum pseudosasae]MDH6637300.1 hypothetical protein [Methylobacterium sp. SuP10 SLI 274]MDH6666479.1 hypothetical protein [Methylorubrum zatmanii]MCP1558391.1 hypothetical protein [Methylorubrum extorquens]MDF9792010.1 hypothetical protein [Methylorubrum extorquens]